VLGSLARGVKDGALNLALRHFANERLRDLGEVLDCRIDTGHRRLCLRVQLKGEAEPIEVMVERYDIEHDGRAAFITLHELVASREWIALALLRLVGGKRYPLPASIARLIQ